MSASLVGSEMCIRDRVRQGRSCCRGVPPRGFAPCARGRPAGGGRVVWDCLLYTSDAADDM
eukprot:3849485-Alexandrium_andersonii.AAC.1